MTSLTQHSGRTGERTGLALLVIATAQLLMVMDGTIVTVGLPVIGNGLKIPEADLDWVLTAYALAFGGLLLAMLGAGAFYLAAVLTAVLLLRPRSARQVTGPARPASPELTQSTNQ